MSVFMIQFLICNIFISGIIGTLLTAKYIFRNHLSSRMQYNLWFLMLGLLAVPFLPVQPGESGQILSWFRGLKNTPAADIGTLLSDTASPTIISSTNWMNDFAVSVSKETTSSTGFILCGIWVSGMLAMVVLIIKSQRQLSIVKKSALPLQNEEIRRLYQGCLKEMNITKTIPVYSTAFLKSPIIVGLFRPFIYLPIHLISDSDKADIRYMLLHELQHYQHKDALVNYLMNLAGVLYWFNPFLWFALKEMQNDREVACDSSVLEMLEQDSYKDYGNTLIDFAEKVSLTPFPFAAGLGGNGKQIKRRILSIVSYQKPSLWKRTCGIAVFAMITALLIGLAPILSTYASNNTSYHWHTPEENITQFDFSSYFQGFDGSFVLYDLEADSWNIYNMENATNRIAPNSTYKIYDALFGLDFGAISAQSSSIPWDHKNYSFDAWNADQTLQTAMQNSVNWYFQSIDQKLGRPAISRYIQTIGYGNEDVSGDLSTYWMESSLKISPVEQVELLTKLQNNTLPFASENMDAVNNALRISSFEDGSLYGKTGTGRVDGQDVNGWFVGYVESSNHTYVFATNIQGTQDATGSKAFDISLSIFSDMNIWMH